MSNFGIEDRGSRIERGAQRAEVLTRSPILDPRSSIPNPRSSILNPRSSKGFSLIELIIVIIIVVVLTGSLLARVPYYQEQAEKAAMEEVAVALQSALVMRYSRLLLRGSDALDISILATDNPINWLQQKPKNYAGEYYDPTPATVAPGRWVFDLKARELIYVVDHGNYFTPGKDGKKWIRYHVKIQYDEAPGGKAGRDKNLIATLFVPTEPYRWFE